MTEALLTLPTHLRRRLVQALESGTLTTRCTEVALRSELGLRQGGSDIVAALAELERLGVTGPAAAAWVRALEQTALSAPRPDLVWSGPTVPGVHARQTRQVYEQLLGSAERSVWVSTYVYYPPDVFEVLSRRMEEKPGLQVTLLLNIRRESGDTSVASDLVRRFADRLWKDWPGASRPAVFYDPRSVDPEAPEGILHAKAVVTDEEAVFVTSANLTEHALDHNLELGLLVRDRALAASVSSHFRELIRQGLLRPLPTV